MEKRNSKKKEENKNLFAPLREPCFLASLENKSRTFVRVLDKHFLEKINGWHIAAIVFIVYAILILISQQVLSGDEVFFYYQALNIREGRFVAFENTQPILWPFILTPFTTSLFMLRLLAALFMAGAVLLLFGLTKRLFSNKAAILACLIFGFSKFTIQYATTVYGEALFVFLILLSFEYFFKIQEKPSLRNFLVFGLIIGLALQSKVQAFILPLFFTAYLIFTNFQILKKYYLQYCSAMFLAAVIFIPYLLVGGLKFLSEKIGPTSIEAKSFAIQSIPAYFTLPTLILAFVAFLYYKTQINQRQVNPVRKSETLNPSALSKKEVDLYSSPPQGVGLSNGVKKQTKIFEYFVIIYFLACVFLISSLFTRYFFPLLPFASIFIGGFVFEKHKTSLKYLVYILLVILFISNLRVLPSLPRMYEQVYFFKLPSGCTELKEWHYSILNRTVELPFFVQPSKSIAEYSSSFNITETYNYIIVNFKDDLITVYLNDKIINTENYYDIFRPGIAAVNLTPGNYSLRLTIYNSINIGGVGQVLLCKQKQLHKGYGFIFPPEEIF